jgi:hypothetical protein
MCMILYMASRSQPPLIPWDDSAPAFAVTPSRCHALPANRFSLSHVVEIGASEGCGCGFAIRSGNPPAAQSFELSDQSVEDRRRLLDYLDDRVRGGPVELWMCWSGDEAVPEEQTLTLSMEELRRNFDVLAERTFVRLA